jgi:hypothetical protein
MVGVARRAVHIEFSLDAARPAVAPYHISDAYFYVLVALKTGAF